MTTVDRHTGQLHAVHGLASPRHNRTSGQSLEGPTNAHTNSSQHSDSTCQPCSIYFCRTPMLHKGDQQGPAQTSMV